MRPSEISKEIMFQQRENYLSHGNRYLYPMPRAAWRQGWSAAVRFFKKMEDIDTFCDHCGKPLMLEECNFSGEESVFCNKCYEKFKIEAL